MYYHVRIDKILHDGGIDMEARKEWDFRSLTKALAMMGRDFGTDAAAWRIQDLTERTPDIMRLEGNLRVALDSTYQYIVMTLRDGVPALGKYDHYEFFVGMRDETERPPAFSFNEDEEESICLPKYVFEPDVMKSLEDILKSFDVVEDFDFVGKAIKSIFKFYADEDDVPADIREIREKESLAPEDYILLGDECQSCGEEQLAAKLYAAGFKTKGEAVKRGEALIQLADLYMNSEWPRNGGREWDVMKAIDLLTEALSLGCVKKAMDALEGMREQVFEEYDEEADVDYFIGHYQADALCLAAFCLCLGVGWKKDVASAKRLYEATLSRGYVRATHYLNEINTGRVK